MTLLFTPADCVAALLLLTVLLIDGNE